MRIRVRGQNYGELRAKPWYRAYWWIGYNSKTNTIDKNLRKWRNKKRKN